MVKRRNSPYASHNRLLTKHLPIDYTPALLAPPPPSPRSLPMQNLLRKRFMVDYVI